MSSDILPFLDAIYIINIYITASCALYALVVATAISSPAPVYITKSDSEAIELPTTFTTERTFAPLRLDSLNAAKLSAVSPDWLIIMTNVFLSITGTLYLNSEAKSTIVVIPAIFSNEYLVADPTWYEDPHATIYILFTDFIN